MKTTAGAVLAALTALLCGCGSVINQSYTTGGRDFDFRRPGCAAEPSAPANAVAVRYLGSGGAAIAWEGDTILLGPYFSHAGNLVTAQFGNLHFDDDRIAQGLERMVKDRVRAIITGHSHFDHIGDVPRIVERHTPDALVYTNTSGVNMLAAYKNVRAESVADFAGKWIRIPRADGTPSAIRFMPVSSAHAPQLCRWDHRPCTYARCEVTEKWTEEWDSKRMRSLCGGAAYAYVIDLLGADDAVRFRIYYNDTAASPPNGIPPHSLGDEHPYDLAILCMASYHFVVEYPEMILDMLQPRHVLVSHYDDFFRKREPASFAPLLTNAKANGFMKRMSDAAHHFTTRPVPPVTEVCGPATDRWSMPVPQWPLYFAP
jgi:hypothetical protein